MPYDAASSVPSGFLRAGTDDLARMREQVLYDGPSARRKLSEFWVLLVLASVIASAGVVLDSTATVIGAMIVAPLMTPILGTVLSTVTADGCNLLRCLVLVVSGAAVVIAIGFLVGLLVPVAIEAANNPQVAGRVHPQLFDLLAALATGIVGSFALVRSDVSATLPGVAIAISLVPPLAVVGITLESGVGSEASGALLLFLTNVGAILLSGLVVLAVYRVFRLENVFGPGRGPHRGIVTTVVVAFVLILVVPLAASTVRISTDAVDRSNVAPVARKWAEAGDWRIESITTTDVGVEVAASGGLPAPEPQALRDALDDAGLGDVRVVVTLIPSQRVELEAT